MPPYYALEVGKYEMTLEPLLFGGFYFAIYDESKNLVIPKQKVEAWLGEQMIKDMGFAEIHIAYEKEN